MASEGIQLRRLRTRILTDILTEKAKLDDALKKENVAILDSFLESFIEEMKKHDKTFAALYQRIYYTGSYYSDLRVSKPDEFDLNLVLRMPKAEQGVPKARKSRNANRKTSTKNITPTKNVNDCETYPVITGIRNLSLNDCLKLPRYSADAAQVDWRENHHLFEVKPKKSSVETRNVFATPDQPGRSQNGSSYGVDICSESARQIENDFYNIGHSSYSISQATSNVVKKKKKNKSKRKAKTLQVKYKSKAKMFQYHLQVPSYMKYKIPNDLVVKEDGLLEFLEDGYMIPGRVRTWIQSVVDKAKNTYRNPPGISKVDCSASGPARTLKLTKRNSDVIDIDLVPAIGCQSSLKPPGMTDRVYAKVRNKLQCFLIPKPYKPIGQAPVSEAECERLWRAHYPEAEKEIIHDLGCVKPIIKLLKLLRDKEQWNANLVASYYLKTIVMWMIIDNASDTEYWNDEMMGDRFLDALRKLAACIDKKDIPYFFSSKYNLLEKLEEPQASNIHNRLHAIIQDIERDADSLWEIFDCKPTF